MMSAAVNTFASDILDLAVKIELECAAVYEALGKAFVQHPELSMFWKLYAETERYHAACIRVHQASLLSHGALEGDAFPAEVEESRELLQRLQHWKKDLRTNQPSVAEAFSLARSLENHTAELHGRTQFFALYPEFQELFQQMVEEDREHRAFLDSAEKRFL